MKKIAVIGSLNMDLVVNVEKATGFLASRELPIILFSPCLAFSSILLTSFLTLIISNAKLLGFANGTRLGNYSKQFQIHC